MWLLFRQKHRLTLILALSMIALLLALAAASKPAVAFRSLEERLVSLEQDALQQVADSERVAVGRLSILNSAVATYPLQGRTVYDFKVLDERDGAIYIVSLGERGERLDAGQLLAEEEAIFRARYGRLEPALAEQLARGSEFESYEVILWLNEPDYDGPARLDPEARVARQAAQQFLEQVDEARAAVVAPLVGPVVQRLSGMGFAATADAYAPAVYAVLPAATIRQLSNWDELDKVYLAPVAVNELDIARATIFATTVHSRGFTGNGVRVAQIEVGGRIATSNPHLADVVQNTTYVCSTPHSHGTAVAGIIRSTHSTHRGIAPGATLWAGGSCSGSASELQNRSTAAADWGARAINLSWGSNIGLTPGANDRFYDTMVATRYRTVVKSAGNEAGPCNSGTGNVTSPGLAYNVITVGNYDDKNTTGWSDDVMNSCSSWRNPTSTRSDRIKPEVSAPGTLINSTTNASPWTGNVGSGTSYAAPMVTGMVALLIQRNSSLSSWPEAIKAIIMATALNNIEGNARLSNYDGAGGIAANRADDVARRVNGNWGGQAYTCGSATTVNLANMSLTGGVRTRAVIAWNNDPRYSSYASQPGADLNLRIRNPAGTIVASSSSWDNTYEIVDFTPASSGTYTMQVVKARCDYNPAYIGWAWYRGN
jgi:hypothetical protein